MIDRTKILREYHDQAIIISMNGAGESISGMIVDDSPADHCVFVSNQNLVEYYETRKKSLLKRVYFKDLTAIEYQ